MMIKDVKLVELHTKYDTVFMNKQFIELIELIEYKCLCCNRSYQQKFDEKLKEHFLNTCKYSNHGNNKIILLLGKGVYPCEYIDD